MSDALYERYKDALRRGHVAAQGGRHDVALDAYRDASRIAPDRALPLVGIAGVLVRVGRRDEALAAFAAALERSPADEQALRGRADLLKRSGDRAAAATTLDRLAGTLESLGRLADATEVAGEALRLAESRDRRAVLGRLGDRLAAPPPDGAEDQADPYGAGVPGSTIDAPDDVAGVHRGEGSPMTSIDDAELGAGAVAWEPEPDPGPPFLPGAATAAVEDAAATGDGSAARARALDAAIGHRATGAMNAAIDACYLALATNPSDADLHLLLATLYVDRGWRAPAADKLRLLMRLADLEADAPTRTRVCEFVRDRFSDDAGLAALCA